MVSAALEDLGKRERTAWSATAEDGRRVDA
jgi:hypothetical protein